MIGIGTVKVIFNFVSSFLYARKKKNHVLIDIPLK